MPYSVLVDETHAVVEVVYDGHVTTSTRICAMEDGAALLSSRQLRRVLVDMRAAIPADDSRDTSDRLALQVAHRPQIDDSRLAYLVSPAQSFTALAGHLAASRHACVQQFECREDALKWLLEEPAG
jgi:hypothetical protein